MAVKQQRKKRLYKSFLDRSATKILCKYCDMQNMCKLKGNKQKEENGGTITRCIVTPNKKIKRHSWERFNKKGEIINLNKHGIPINRLP